LLLFLKSDVAACYCPWGKTERFPGQKPKYFKIHHSVNIGNIGNIA